MQAERAYLITVVACGAVVLAIAGAAAVQDPSGQLALGPMQGGLLLALALGSWLVLRNLLLLRWRGQHVALAPDETLVVLALASLTPVQTLLFALPAMTLFQVVTKRTWLKGAFNVATLLLATGAAIALHLGAVRAGVPSLVAILPAIILYTTTTHLLVSGVFALRERTSPLRVFRERFVVPTALHVAMGSGVGLSLLALWRLHPLAVLALAPFVWLARENMQLAARAEREVEAQRTLGQASRDLVGTADMDAAASRLLDVCAPLFRAGRVEIELDGPSSLSGRAWRRDTEDGPRSAGGMEARLPAQEGRPAGVLRIHPSARTNEAYVDADEALLQVVAGEAAAALANAQALQDIEVARAELEATRIARPFVRRIVRALMDETDADPSALLRVGEALAKEATGEKEEALLRAYAEMGLGELRMSARRGDRHEFAAADLFERAIGSRRTTCYLALGFLVGVVKRVEGADAVGTETTCESRGDARCSFVVVRRAHVPHAPRPLPTVAPADPADRLPSAR